MIFEISNVLCIRCTRYLLKTIVPSIMMFMGISLVPKVKLLTTFAHHIATGEPHYKRLNTDSIRINWRLIVGVEDMSALYRIRIFASSIELCGILNSTLPKNIVILHPQVVFCIRLKPDYNHLVQECSV